MKNLKNIVSDSLVIFIITCFVYYVPAHSQDDKNAAKLQMLKDKVTMAEAKVADAERKLFIADSLIETGYKMADEADAEFSRLDEEKKNSNKEYVAQYKALSKETKSKDPEVAKRAGEELKTLETSYNEETKKREAEIKILTKQAEKGNSNVEKGKDKKKDAEVKVKESNEKLEAARAAYEDFAGSLEEKSE